MAAPRPRPGVPGGIPGASGSIAGAFDRAAGTDLVKINKIKPDLSDFGRRFDPGHPAADANGYVLTPNVNTLIEVMDMREAERSYEANLNVIRSTKTMMQKTIDILR